MDRVIPFPSSSAPWPKAGDFLLVKPTSGSKWNYGQVSSISGSSMDVKLVTGTTQTVKAGEYVILK